MIKLYKRGNVMNKETKKRLILMIVIFLITLLYISFTKEINNIIDTITLFIIINKEWIYKILVLMLLIRINLKIKKQ